MKHDTSINISHNDNSTAAKLSLFGLPLHGLPPLFRFMFLALSVFFFYVLYGYVLELIFKLDGMQPHGWYLTLIQFAYYTLFSFLQLTMSSTKITRKIPLKTYCIIAVLTVGTMGFSNSSMGYLNYPTQVIFKSCKLIPVMIGSMIILGKTYSFAQILACLCMSAGLIWFTLADSSVQPSFSLKGVVFVSLALLCDAVIGNVQEGAMKKHQESTTSVIFYSYSIGFFIILLSLFLSGTIFPAFTFASQHPWEVYGRGALMSSAGFCGVQVVLLLVSEYGALTAVTVTTFRKALSIILSFIFFAKPFTIQYIWGGLLVALGIYLNVVSKQSGGSTVFVSAQKLYLKLQRLTQPKLTNLAQGQRRLLMDV